MYQTSREPIILTSISLNLSPFLIFLKKKSVCLDIRTVRVGHELEKAAGSIETVLKEYGRKVQIAAY
jgi:hypothetical protein